MYFIYKIHFLVSLCDLKFRETKSQPTKSTRRFLSGTFMCYNGNAANKAQEKNQ